MYYYGSRYYDPELGRFIQPDPTLDDICRYAYTHNNPINYIDPTGNEAVSTGPTIESSGSFTLGGITIENEPSQILLPTYTDGRIGPSTYKLTPEDERPPETGSSNGNGSSNGSNNNSTNSNTYTGSGYTPNNNWWSNQYNYLNGELQIAWNRFSNLDFGRDYGEIAANSFNRGEYFTFAVYRLFNFGEAAVDMGLAYLGASALPVAGELMVSQFKKGSPNNPVTTSDSVNNLIREAQLLYPNKAGKIELHHIQPLYLKGPTNGPTVPLDAAYHQVITNAFRKLWGYGQGMISPERAQEIMQRVYGEYPLPGGH